jgi:hypothetical protein
MADGKYYNYSSSRRPTQAASSRRTKVEEKKMVRQTVIFSVLAVVLAVLFFLVIIPGVVRFLGGLAGGPVVKEDELLPQTPFISSPASATSSAKLTFSGFNQKDNTIVVLDNGQESTRVKAADDGSFSADLTLQEGENKLSAYAINPRDKESAVSQEYLITYDNKPPKLEITEPTDGASIQGRKNQNATVKGNTEPETRVTINDRLIFVNDDGTFSTSFRLENGDNGIAFKATDPAGNVTEHKITVKFSE